MLWRSLVVMTCAAVVASFDGASSQHPLQRVETSQSSEHEYLVNIKGKMNGSIHAELQLRGISVTGYLGNGRLLVYGSEDSIINLTSYEKVSSVEERSARDKISEVSQDAKHRRGRRLEDDGEKKKSEHHDITVSLVKTDRSEKHHEEISRKIMASLDGCDVKKVKKNRLRVTLPAASTMEQVDVAMIRLAGFKEVTNVELVEKHTLRNENAQILTRGSSLSDGSLSALSGAGQIVGVADTGLDYDMCFFRDDGEEVAIGSGETANNNHRKVVQYNPFADQVEGEVGGHGTHVCGSIAGQSLDGTLSEYNGMAPNAKLAFLDIGLGDQEGLSVPLDLYNDMLDESYGLGAQLHSNSWGSASQAYTTDARDFDEFMYDQKDFLALAAAGNTGTAGDGSVSSPATLKNGLAVGSSGNVGGGWREQDQHGVYQEQVAYFSSKGPTADGRLKPDVLAPGDVVVSAFSDISMDSNNCDVGGASGTSMSTPLTAGTAALVREYYSEGYYPSGVPTPGDSLSPSGALVKATLIHSAQAVYGKRPAPSFDQGYGRVNLENVLLGADNQGDFNLYVEDSAQPLATGDVSEPLCFQVQDTQDFKVTLVWTDMPGEVNSDHALVNDLTLAVVQETEQGDIRTTQGNHRFNRNGAELTVGGVGVRFGYTTLGATLDITPPLTAQESVIGDACTPPTPVDVSGKVFVHDVMGVGCDLLTAATNAQNGGAVAMVVITDVYEPGTVFDGDVPSTITIPVVTTNHISAFSAAGGGSVVRLGVEESGLVDYRNNVEQVRVRHSGRLSVVVLGDEVATPVGQKYALVLTGDYEVLEGGGGEGGSCPPLPECVLCLHGTCGGGGECECEENWTGESCGVEICPNMCSGNGECTSEGCECSDGYRGEDCGTSHCGGVLTLTTGSSGTITHDATGGPYQNFANCVWHLIPEAPNANIRFWWGEGDIQLEDGWDFLEFLDGANEFSPVLTSVTGRPEAEDGLFSSFSSASIVFMSDEESTDAGFTIQWEALTCLDDCNGDAGTCPVAEEPAESGDGTCDCSPGFSGPGCGMASCTESSCLNGGECTGAGVCQCPVNWFGETCDWSGQCKGLAVYTADAGEFGDGSGDNSPYENSVNCGFYLEPAGGATSIQFWFKAFDLENGWDYLYVYDDLHQTNLLLTLTGNAITSETGFEFPTASLYFHFFADAGVTAGGFELEYVADSVDPCGSCRNGDCVDGECQCHPGWTGILCGEEICPNACSGNGECTDDGCVCEPGHYGDDCSDTHCRGDVTLRGSNGVITHDPSGDSYDNGANCVWWIIPEAPNANIRFWWGEGDIQLEDGWDFLFILDGGEGSPPVIRQLTGDPEEEELMSYSPAAGVVFTSDSLITAPGFTLQWEALTCLDDCNGDAGTCPAAEEPESGDGTCDCSPGFSGPGCGMASCTESSCLNGGECTGAGVCQCPVNWFGETCDWSGQCNGLAVYTAASGEFEDGSGGDSPYGNFLNCGFYVEPGGGGAASIEFTVGRLDLESGYDFLYVYDGLHQTNLLLTLTGNTVEPGTVYEFNVASLYFRLFTDSGVTAGGFQLSYTSVSSPVVFSPPEYTFTFIGGVSVEGLMVGSVSAFDPAGGEVTYSLVNVGDAKFYWVDPATGEMWVEKKQVKGAVYTIPVQACAVDSGLCRSVDVTMVVLNGSGCLSDGTCPDTGPVFTDPPYSFSFVGGRRIIGRIVGMVEAVDPVYPDSVVTYDIPAGHPLANKYEMQSDGGIMGVRRQRRGFVYYLAVEACSMYGCTIVDVELVVNRR